MTDLTRFLDPLALLLVIGGSFGVAIVQGTREDTVQALRALGGLWRPFRADDRRAAVARLERLARRHGFLAIENETSGDAAIDRAVASVVDGAPIAALRETIARERIERQRRHAVAPAFWCAVADAGPAMGMIGTILGLVQMFARMDDVAKVGPAMALALLATFYGAVLANIIAAPIAARLQRLAALEEEARATIEADLIALAESEPATARPQRRRVA